MTPARSARAALVPAAALAVLASGAGIGWAVAATDTDPVVVVREPLAQAVAPQGAPGRTLGLSRVTVMPGAELASHHHPGTQIARIENGTLTYSVETGSVKVMKGPADDPTLVRRIKAGQTGRIRAGQWIVEQRTEVHHAANHGTVPVVIYLASLFTTGSPPSLPN
jgi:quercetin dioxygenase-like cupin family protein